MRAWGLVPGLVVAALARPTPGLGAPPNLCEILGVLPAYVAVADTVRTRTSVATYGGTWVWGTSFAGDVCASKAQFRIAEVSPYESSRAGITAVRRTGAAVSFQRGPVGTDSSDPPNVVYSGNVVTGGGFVRGTVELYDGVVDTSGTHAAVAACTEALATAHRASAALAALPPDQVFGTIQVRLGEDRLIETNPGDVVQIDRIDVEGVRLPPRSPGEVNNKYCGDEPADARLTIRGPAVINVGALGVGNCGILTVDGMLNLPGRGKSVHLGVQTSTLDILAPDRVVTVDGTSDDGGSYPGHLWVKSLVTTGLTYVGWVSTLGCTTTPAP